MGDGAAGCRYVPAGLAGNAFRIWARSPRGALASRFRHPIEIVHARLTLVDSQGIGTTVRESLVGDYLAVSLLAPGAYRLRLAPDQPGVDFFLDQWFDGATGIDGATPVTVPGGGAVGRVTAHLIRGGAIDGEFTGGFQAGGEWSLAVTPADRDTVWCVVNRPADSADFQIRGLADGAYRIGASAEVISAYSPAMPMSWYGGTASWDSAVVITVQDHQVVGGIEIQPR